MSGAVRGAPAAGRVRLGAHERREQILEAASECFRERPEGAVSLDEIADAVGVTRALINHHFGTKRGLYVEVVRRLLETSIVAAPEYVHGATPEQRLRQTVDRFFDEIGHDRELWRAAMRAGGIGDTEIFDLVEAARETAVQTLVATLGLGPMSAVTPRQMALLRGWTGFAEAIILQHLEYERLTREQAREMIVSGGMYCLGTIVAARRRRTP